MIFGTICASIGQSSAFETNYANLDPICFFVGWYSFTFYHHFTTFIRWYHLVTSVNLLNFTGLQRVHLQHLLIHSCYHGWIWRILNGILGLDKLASIILWVKFLKFDWLPAKPILSRSEFSVQTFQFLTFPSACLWKVQNLPDSNRN